MKPLSTGATRFARPVATLAAAALLALPGAAIAKDHHGSHAAARHDGHHHHRRDHQNAAMAQEAGAISSFDATTGKLTIALSAGESITGLVTEETEIKCEGVDQSRDQGDRPGDDSGEGADGQGDDNGGDGHRSGDAGESESASGSEAESEGSEDAESGEGGPESGEGSCGVASLTPGAVVGTAELRLEGGAAVFREIELGAGRSSAGGS